MNVLRSVLVFAFSCAPVLSANAQWRGGGYTPPPEEPEYIQRMNERCRSLYNAMQGGKAVSREIQEGMRREYRRDCEEAASDMRQQIYDERNHQRWEKADDRRDAYRQSRQQYQQNRAENTINEARERDEVRQHRDGCAESRRILMAKKARTDLTPGERADLQRFEDNTLARCGR